MTTLRHDPAVEVRRRKAVVRSRRMVSAARAVAVPANDPRPTADSGLSWWLTVLAVVLVGGWLLDADPACAELVDPDDVC